MSIRPTASIASIAALAVLLTAGTASAKSRLDGSLQITNDRQASLSVRIDGAPRGNIPPGQTVLLRDVPNGVRVIKLRGPRGAKVVREVSVAPRKRSSLRVAPILGRAKIVNRAGITLRVSIDGRYFTTLRDGERMSTGMMRAGNYRLTAAPASASANRGPMLKRNLRIVAGQPTRVKLDGYLASLRVTNPFHRTVNVFISGQRVGRLERRQTLVFGGLTPGVHSVVFKNRGRLLANASLTLPMGGQKSFTPIIARNGNVQITNNYGRRIKVVVAGRMLGHIAPGETRFFRDFPVGKLDGYAKIRKGGKVFFTVKVGPRRTANVVLGTPVPKPHDHGNHKPRPRPRHASF